MNFYKGAVLKHYFCNAIENYVVLLWVDRLFILQGILTNDEAPIIDRFRLCG